MSVSIRAVALCLAALSGVAAANESDTFHSPTAGFEITKPADWQFVTAAEVQENLERTKLGDEEFRAAMLKYATVPMVAMMKYPEPFEDVNPSFKVNIKPLGQFKGRTPVEIMSILLPQLEKVFRDFKLSQAPTRSEVSGLEGAYARIDYTLETAEGATFPCTSELWIVPRGDYFFLLGAGTRQDESTGSRSEVQAILSSIRIDR